jgi:hypothetical protein
LQQYDAWDVLTLHSAYGDVLRGYDVFEANVEFHKAFTTATQKSSIRQYK